MLIRVEIEFKFKCENFSRKSQLHLGISNSVTHRNTMWPKLFFFFSLLLANAHSRDFSLISTFSFRFGFNFCTRSNRRHVRILYWCARRAWMQPQNNGWSETHEKANRKRFHFSADFIHRLDMWNASQHQIIYRNYSKAFACLRACIRKTKMNIGL